MTNIKLLREKAGLTQEALANLLSLDRTTVTKWETGESMPRSDKLPELAKILKCEIGDLFNGSTY